MEIAPEKLQLPQLGIHPFHFTQTLQDHNMTTQQSRNLQKYLAASQLRGSLYLSSTLAPSLIDVQTKTIME
jgi:alkylhydroperoxidase family enzyme